MNCFWRENIHYNTTGSNDQFKSGAIEIEHIEPYK